MSPAVPTVEPQPSTLLMDQDHLQLVLSDQGIARLRLNRPDKHNAVTPEMLSAMAHAQRLLHRAARRGLVRVVILSGVGPSFCSGLDFPTLMKRPLTLLRFYLRLYSPMENLFQRWAMGWRRLPVPVLAAIHGHCYGAGLQLALGADRRFAAPEADLSFLEMRWGLVPDMGGPTLVRELMRIDQAKDLMITGRKVLASEALALGLISELVDDPMAPALAHAQTLLALPPKAVAQAKWVLQAAWSADTGDALAAERRAQRRLMGRAEQRALLKR